MLALAFPWHPDNPLSALSGGLWAWVGLVPLLCVLPTARSRRHAFRLGWMAGFVFHMSCLYWIGNTQGGGLAVVAGAALGAAWLSLYTGLFGVSQYVAWQRFGERGLLAAPVLWTATEYLLSLGELGFPWLLLAHSQGGVPVLLQAASVTGAWGVTAAIVSTSALIAVGLRSEQPVLLGAGAAVPALLAVGGWAAMQQESSGGVRVAVVQNAMGLEKWRGDGLTRSLTSLQTLSRGVQDQSPDLYVWPETAVPCNLGWRPDCRRLMRDIVDSLGAPVLTGGPDTTVDTREPTNSAFLFTPGQQEVPTYAKMHLVPFGERTPWRDSLPLLRDIDWAALTGDLGPAEFAPGRERALFHLDSARTDATRFATLICFESVFPDLVRQSVRDGADFLVVITNDSWFGATSGPFQHAGIAVARAIENRIGIARCATNGVSLFIDRFGRTRLHTEYGPAAVRVSDIAPRDGETIYNRFGDWFPRGAVGLSLLLMLWARARPGTDPAS